MRFSYRLTFDSIYRNNFSFSIIMYWNYVPFFIYILTIMLNFVGSSNQLAGLFLATVIALFLLLYQLYQYSYSFFLIQEASMGVITISAYDLSDLFKDFGVKLKLLLLRLFYYLPMLVVFVAVIGFSGFSIPNIGIDAALSWIMVAFPLVSLVAVYSFVVENLIMPAALYKYAYSGNVISGMNIYKVALFIFKNLKGILQLALLNLIFGLAAVVITIALTPLLIMPFIGVAVISIWNGFTTSWYMVYMPNLYGQLWAQAKE